MPLPSLLLTGLLIPIAGALHLNPRDEIDDGPPRIVKFDLQRNRIRDPLTHDDQRLKKRSSSNSLNVDIQNQETLYSLNITIGTPAQQFTVNIDTGSSDLWVNSADSKLCSLRSNPCSDTGTYSANSSSTYKYVNSAFNISYAGGDSASGDYVTDTVRMSGQTVKSLQFGVGYNSSSPLAILGIGYTLNEAQASNEGMKPYNNLPAKLADDGTIASNAYSLWLNDLDANTGSLLFGGVDHAQYAGDLVTLPVQKVDGEYAEFFITLSSVELQGQTLADNMGLAVLLDSGTSLTYLPNDIVSAIYEAVDARFDETQGSAVVPCSLGQQNAKMTFRFGDSISIQVPFDELVLDTLTDHGGSSNNARKACLFGIAPAGNNPNILGDTFLRSAYVVYDLENNEVSLAQSKQNATESNVSEIGNGKNAVPSAVSATGNGVTATEGLPGNPTATGGGGGQSAGGMVMPSWGGLVVGFVLTTMGSLNWGL